MPRISCSRGKVSWSPSRSVDSAATTRSLAWAWMTGSSCSMSEPPAGLEVGQSAHEHHRDPGADRDDQRVPARAGDDADDVHHRDPQTQHEQVRAAPDRAAVEVHETDHTD